MRLGVDVVSLKRVENLPSSFATRILSSEELKLYNSFNPERKKEFLAGRWAGKEAYIKASGEMNRSFSSISILPLENGKPQLYVDGSIVGEISISHDEVAFAVVVLS